MNAAALLSWRRQQPAATLPALQEKEERSPPPLIGKTASSQNPPVGARKTPHGSMPIVLSLSLRVTRRNTVKPPGLTIFGARQVCRASTATMRRLADATPPKRCPRVARGGHAGLGRAPVSSDSLRDQAFVGAACAAEQLQAACKTPKLSGPLANATDGHM